MNGPLVFVSLAYYSVGMFLVMTEFDCFSTAQNQLKKNQNKKSIINIQTCS